VVIPPRERRASATNCPFAPEAQELLRKALWATLCSAQPAALRASGFPERSGDLTWTLQIPPGVCTICGALPRQEWLGLVSLCTVVEAVLNHKSGTIRGVAAVYNRYSYADEKGARSKLDRFSQRLDRA